MLRSLSIILALAACLVAEAVKAEPTPVCFDPGTSRLSPAGYSAVRSLSVEQSGAPSFAHVRLFARGAEEDDLIGRREAEIRIELAMNGVSYGRIETAPDGPAASEDCLVAEVVGLDVSRQNPPYVALWHYYGPYFERGSTEVPPRWRNSLRFLVATYRAGSTRFCIEGHSDTEPAAEVSMDLSRRRAENVALALVRHGVRWEDTQVRAYGETRLARPTADGVAESLNRRVFVDVRQRCSWR